MSDSKEEETVLHKGHLVLGDEMLVKGGLSVQFQKKKRRFFVLYNLGGSNLLLQGYRDEKSFRKGQEANVKGRQRKSSCCPLETVNFVTSVKVHKVELKSAKKLVDALIVVSGALPKFFSPDNKEELEQWYKVFTEFSRDSKGVKKRRSPTPNKESHRPPSTGSSRASISSQEEVFPMDGEERDSGCSTSSRPRSFNSDRSSTSSDELNNSGKYFPSHFIIDEDDHSTSLSGSYSPSHPISSSPSSAATFGVSDSRDVRKSMFFRTENGSYVERLIGPHDSGVFETIDDYPIPSPTASTHDPVPSPITSAPVSIHDPLYDRLPPRNAPNSPRFAPRPMPSIPEKVNSANRRHGTYVSPVRLFASEKHDANDEADADQAVWNDDGSKHPYVNMTKIQQRRNTGRQPHPPRKISLPGMDPPSQSDLSESPVSRGRSYTMPTMPQGSPESESPYSICPKERPLPKPDLDRSMDLQTVMWENAQGHDVPITVDRQDVQDALALVDIRGNVWIAGWKTGEQNVFGKLRVGDQLVQVNEQKVTTAEWANTFIKTSSKDKITLVIKRLPHANIVICKRVNENTPWGIELKANEIVNVGPGPAQESGLTPKSDVGAFSNKRTDWVITEIVHMPVKLNCGKNVLKRYLETCTLELPIIVQPKDFITDLAKGLNKMKRATLYHVG